MSMKLNIKYVVLIMVLIAVVYTGVRSTVITNAERTVRTMLRDWQSDGIRVAYSGLKQGGFPYRIELSMENFRLKDKAATYDIQADHITLISHVWTPDHWMIHAENAQVKLLDGSIRFTDETLMASLRQQEDGKWVLVIDSSDSADGSDFTLTHFPGLRQKFTAVNWVFSTVLMPDDTTGSNLYEKNIADFRLQLAGGQIGDGTAPHERILGLEVSGSLTGTGLQAWRNTDLRNWSGNGGLFDIRAFNLAVGSGKNTAALGANGTLSLGDRGYPLGSMSVKVQDPTVLADILKSGGLITHGDALNTLKTLPEKSDISLIIQGGGLLMGDQLLARLPKVMR